MEELAEKTGYDATTLAETISKYNEDVAAGKDTLFGRGEAYYDSYAGSGSDTGEARTGEQKVVIEPFELLPIEPPYYAAQISMVLLNTQGGPKRNENAQTLDWDGNSIPRLYNCGEFGSIYAYMYNGWRQRGRSHCHGAGGWSACRRSRSLGRRLGKRKTSVCPPAVAPRFAFGAAADEPFLQGVFGVSMPLRASARFGAREAGWGGITQLLQWRVPRGGSFAYTCAMTSRNDNPSSSVPPEQAAAADGAGEAAGSGSSSAPGHWRSGRRWQPCRSRRRPRPRHPCPARAALGHCGNLRARGPTAPPPQAQVGGVHPLVHPGDHAHAGGCPCRVRHREHAGAALFRRILAHVREKPLAGRFLCPPHLGALHQRLSDGAVLPAGRLGNKVRDDSGGTHQPAQGAAAHCGGGRRRQSCRRWCTRL